MRCSPRPSLSRSPCSSCLVPGTWIGAHRIRLPIRRTAGPTATRSITKLLTANSGGLCPGAPTAREIRAVWPACGGAADVPRRDCVGVTSEPAAHTGEYTLSGAVASLTDTLDVFKGYHGRCAFATIPLEWPDPGSAETARSAAYHRGGAAWAIMHHKGGVARHTSCRGGR